MLKKGNGLKTKRGKNPASEILNFNLDKCYTKPF
jgi:hypothetical protein